MKLKAQKKYPKVSIILPFYNRVKGTLKAISSVESQNYPNTELIVINDGSSDPDIHLIKSKISTIPNSIYINNPVNSGPGFARNLGIERASGTYLSYLDSDDIWHPKKLDIQINIMIKNNWLFSHTSYSQFNIDNKNEKIIHSGKKNYNFPLIAFSCRIATPTVTIHRKIALQYKFNAEYRVGEDHILWTKLSKLTKLYGIDQALSQVNISNNSTFRDYFRLEASQKKLRNEFLQDKKILFYLHSFYNYCKYYFYHTNKILFNRKTKKYELIIYANNINNGGGLNILTNILNSIKSENVLVYLDSRINPISISNKLIHKNFEFKIKFIKASIFFRFQSEISLFLNSSEKTTVLCFGNLPPIFKLKAKVFLFVHNKLLVSPVSPFIGKLKTVLRLFAEKYWLYFFSNNVDLFIVQTCLMKNLLRAFLNGNEKPIFIVPLFSNHYLRHSKNKHIKYDFIYVASGESHKNHKNLIEAWVLLAQEGFFPSLCLTVNKNTYAALNLYINTIKVKHNLKLFNKGEVSVEEISNLYSASRALIFPSLSESFGLPLLEARYLEIPIIASELDFVREVANPVETFDPKSANSIANAVKRHLGVMKDLPLTLSAEDFIDLVRNKKIYN